MRRLHYPKRAGFRSTLRVAALLFAPHVACGFTDPGSGTGTLNVDARAIYVGDTGRMQYTVRVSKDNVPLPDASVILADGDSRNPVASGITTLNGDGTEAVFEVDDDNPGYRRRLILRVERANDGLEAQLEGPGPHVLETPRNQESVLSGRNLRVEWSTDDGIRADRVRVSVGSFGKSLGMSEESGFLTIEASSLPPPGSTEAVRVARHNHVNLAGGVNGSLFELRYDVFNHINFK